MQQADCLLGQNGHNALHIARIPNRFVHHDRDMLYPEKSLLLPKSPNQIAFMRSDRNILRYLQRCPNLG